MAPDKSKSHIPLLTVDQKTGDEVKRAAASDERLVLVSVGDNIEDLVAHLERESASAVVVDIDPDPFHSLEELRRVISRWSDTRFILLSEWRRNDLLLEAMQIGARQFIQKKFIRSELPQVLEQLIFDRAHRAAVERGLVLTVLSASGGCGATTIAVNLANELMLESSRPVLLVDMDLAYGAVSRYLGVKGNYGIADVLTHGNAVDLELVRTSASTYMEDFDILLSPASVNFQEPPRLDYGNLPSALAAFGQAYPFTVIDAPHLPANVASLLAAKSCMTLLVLQMTVKDIQYARDLRSSLIHGGLVPSRIVPIINRYKKRNRMISFDECKRALGEERIEIVRNDFRSAVSGVNFGKPLSEVAPLSALRKDVRRLAQKLGSSEACDGEKKA